MEDLNLASDFPQATREQWLELVEGVLEGADFGKKLVARTHDGIEIQPLYPKAEAAAPVAREQPGAGGVAAGRSSRAGEGERTRACRPRRRCRLPRSYSRRCASARGFGVGTDNVEDLDRSSPGVMLDSSPSRSKPRLSGAAPSAEQGAALVERRGLDPAALTPSISVSTRSEISPEPGDRSPLDGCRRTRRDTVSTLRIRVSKWPCCGSMHAPVHEAGPAKPRSSPPRLPSAWPIFALWRPAAMRWTALATPSASCSSPMRTSF